ncbi:Retrotransposon gag protein [Gossypium australe]|uniref:Retrotransposon gag protein n=1 Tax=Gossypium australe TaxID=47621 RepID=A0A5B6W8M8_9ROSI|nr:Retrotransposon gag protein [Gossypium australe]
MSSNINSDDSEHSIVPREHDRGFKLALEVGTGDVVCLRLFPFSLYDDIADWLDLLEPGSITTREDLAEKFLQKFFPINRTIQPRRDIANFKQMEGKTLYEAWSDLSCC